MGIVEARCTRPQQGFAIGAHAARGNLFTRETRGPWKRWSGAGPTTPPKLTSSRGRRQGQHAVRGRGGARERVGYRYRDREGRSKRVFSSGFARRTRSDHPPLSGDGLALALVKELTEAYGGCGHRS